MRSKLVKTIKLFIVNLFTIARLIGALILPFIYMNCHISVCAVWIICLFLTDAIDGFLARKLHVSTFFGSSMDALSDKILNSIAFIILGLTFITMIPPIILEFSIMLIIYSSYRFGGNVQSSKTGKIKTIILDICIILSYILLSLPTLTLKSNFVNYLINNTTNYIDLLGCICTIAEIIALVDYKKKNNIIRSTPQAKIIKSTKKVRKTFKEVIRDAFDTEYYLSHKNESIMKQFYKSK